MTYDFSVYFEKSTGDKRITNDCHKAFVNGLYVGRVHFYTSPENVLTGQVPVKRLVFRDSHNAYKNVIRIDIFESTLDELMSQSKTIDALIPIVIHNALKNYTPIVSNRIAA